MKKRIITALTAVLLLLMWAVPASGGEALMAMCEDYIISQLKSGAEVIDISEFRIKEESVTDFYFDILYRHPELFYVERHISYSYMPGGNVTEITPSYLCTGAERERMAAEFDGFVAQIADYASAAPTDLGKLLLINDFFCVNFEYDETRTYRDPYTLFAQGIGVCESYSLAFAAVLNELGIPNIYVSSEAMNHSWNMVQLDGEWYHIDITWNDPTSDVPLRACHQNFLRSDEGMRETGHYGWEADVKAVSTKYDSAFWIDIRTPLPVSGTYVFYTSPEPDENAEHVIRAWDMATGSVSDIARYSILRSDRSYMYYTGYNALFTDGQYLYYGAIDKLYRLESDGSATPIHSTGDETICIWSAWLNGDALYLLTGADIETDCQIEAFSFR